ncbi:MAG: M50 family metallopeptidase [Patescibacteria group bacterium]
MSIILFVIILGVLVVSHEFGHFIVAKLFGMRVDEFGFGFPPRLFGYTWKGTLYSFNAIPFGGFVRIYGEDALEEGAVDTRPADSFTAKSRWKQAAVVVAGVCFNLILAWGLISSGYMLGLPMSLSQAPAGSTLLDAKTVVTFVGPDSPAEKAGLQAGDEIVALSGAPDRKLEGSTPEAIQQFIAATGGRELTLTYRRGESLPRDAHLIPVVGIVPDKLAVGIAMDTVGTLQLGFFSSIVEGARTTAHLLQATAGALFGLIRSVFVGQANLDGVTGPVGLIGVVGDASALGFVYLLTLTAMISVNLAVMNLVPFPALDGGRLLFILIEAVRRKEIRPRTSATWNAAGFFALILLMAILTYGDVMKLVRG